MRFLFSPERYGISWFYVVSTYGSISFFYIHSTHVAAFVTPSRLLIEFGSMMGFWKKCANGTNRTYVNFVRHPVCYVPLYLTLPLCVGVKCMMMIRVSSMYDTRKSMQPARSQRKYVLVLELLTTTAVQRVRYWWLIAVWCDGIMKFYWSGSHPFSNAYIATITYRLFPFAMHR